MLEYATFIFNAHLSKSRVGVLENIKRRALVSSLGAYRHSSHSKLLHESGIKPLAIPRKYFGPCHLYKVIHGPAPEYSETCP